MKIHEMIDNGYTVERDRERLKLFQYGEYVACVSPLAIGAGWGFDWHRADQWHLTSRDVVWLANHAN